MTILNVEETALVFILRKYKSFHHDSSGKWDATSSMKSCEIKTLIIDKTKVLVLHISSQATN